MQRTIAEQPIMRLVYESKTAARVWKCNACGLKLFLAQKTDYPSIRCLCGSSQWKSENS